MRKITATILSLCALCAFAMPKAAVFSAPFSASAETVYNVSSSQPMTELLSPSSYEQYLALNAPSDVAATEEYTAIADGNIIHVYDRESDSYLRYEHTKKITKLQFNSANKLYFLDVDTNLSMLDPDRLDKGETQATSLNFVCSTFIIHDSNLYYSHTSGSQSRISKAPLSNLSNSTTLLEGLSLSPALAYYNNELYYTESGKYLNKINPETKSGVTFVAAFPAAILSMSVSENVLTCVTDENNFYAYDLLALAENKQATAVTPITKATGGYVSLSLHGNYVYAIQRKTIKQYSVKDTAFTDYEISSSSSAANRLSGATDVYLSNERLFLTDNGNKRVSVFNTTAKTFEQSIPTSLSAKYLATDGATLLISGDSGAELYDLSEDNYGVKIADKTNFAGNIVGVAGVYGKYYLVTDTNFFYSLTANADGKYVWSSAQKDSAHIPSLMTADAYGNLYVVCETSVYLYTENNFTTTTPSNVELTNKLPEGTEKISVDYGENLYALKDNTLHKFSKTGNTKYTQSKTISLAERLVYEDRANATSFTFSIEENWTYIVYGGNYLVRTTKLNLPTVKNIPVDNADAKLFNDPAQFSVILTKPNALIVEYDFEQFNGADVFPYLSFERREDSFTALKIGEAGTYDLLVTFDKNSNEYKTYLVYSSSCQSVLRTQYETLYEEPYPTGYLTGNASLYKYPFLHKSLTNGELPRGATLTILGEIKMLERDYYYVSYETENSETITGYIPAVYLTQTTGETHTTQLAYGDTSSKTDVYGRLVYLLLGGAAICVLSDFLIIRKLRNKENDKE